MKNYRKLFEQSYNIKIPDDMEIHHIDLDHNNNELENLMIIPKELHNEYHKVLSEFERTRIQIINIITGNELNNIVESENILISFLEIKKKCNKWLDFTRSLERKGE